MSLTCKAKKGHYKDSPKGNSLLYLSLDCTHLFT